MTLTSIGSSMVKNSIRLSMVNKNFHIFQFYIFQFYIFQFQLFNLIENDKFRYIKSYFPLQSDSDLLIHYYDGKEVNLCKWIYAIQLNFAWKTCVEGEGLGPNRIYCALSITNQRTLKISPSSEKAFFQTALTMWDGFFWSQSNSLTAL